MGDKEGDDFWIASAGGKSSMKTTFSSGKDDSSRKARKGKKVQFEYEAQENGIFSSKSGGKDGFTNGKGDKTKTGPKKTVVKKDTAPLELNVEEELPKNVKCIMDCEAASILDGIKDQMVDLSADVKVPESFNMALEYTKASSRFPDPHSVMQALQILRKHDASESELCMIANVCPESADEVFDLVPSLKDLNNFESDPEEFAKTVCKDMNIKDSEVGPAMAVAIREQLYEGGGISVDLMKYSSYKSSAARKRREWDALKPSGGH